MKASIRTFPVPLRSTENDVSDASETVLQAKVLLVGNNSLLIHEMAGDLCEEGYRPFVAPDARQCLEMVTKDEPDLIILDTVLPSASGFAVCRILREQSDVPIILLLANAEEWDRLFGYELGADVCLAKPFSRVELITRARLLLKWNSRLHPLKLENQIHIGDLTLLPEALEIRAEGRTIDLSGDQVRLLRFLALRPGEAVTFESIREHMWGKKKVSYSTLAEMIRRIRLKIEADPSHPKYLLSVHGVGYKLQNEVGRD